MSSLGNLVGGSSIANGSGAAWVTSAQEATAQVSKAQRQAQYRQQVGKRAAARAAERVERRQFYSDENSAPRPRPRARRASSGDAVSVYSGSNGSVWYGAPPSSKLGKGPLRSTGSISARNTRPRYRYALYNCKVLSQKLNVVCLSLLAGTWPPRSGPTQGEASLMMSAIAMTQAMTVTTTAPPPHLHHVGHLTLPYHCDKLL